MIGSKLRATALLLAGIVASPVAQAQTPAALIYDPGVGAISFAAGDLKAALLQNGYTVSDLPLGDPSTATQAVRIILTTSDVSVPGMPTPVGLTNQGYAIQRVVDGAATNWWVIGYDAPGAMYGGLELAEAVKLADGLGGVTNRQTNPYLANRGIKFNIPLDVRTPSYSDDSSSAQANIANMWETNFWTGMLDNMARHRLNLLSLWSLHPFPSLVRVPEYPNVALADVKQKSGALWDASLVGTGMYNSSWPLTTLKTMTMDEKIAFWRWVMQYAQDRGIQLYVFTWNIFVYGTEPSGYGITDRSTNPITTDYFRKSVRTLFNTYPLLAGVGLTVGENMGGIGSAAEEQWAWDTYGMGVSDAMADATNPASPYYAPGRVIRLVHRAHQADLNQIISYFSPLPGATNADSTLAFSFKYSQAHMHSSTQPQFIYQNNWFNTIPAGKKIFLTVRNDDMYYLRWGDPDFARAYMTNLPDRSKIAGFYMGPDGYTWGREYLSTEPESPRQLVIEKMWYSFLLYGRLAYEPTLPNDRFEAIVGERFPEVASSSLFSGWASVSKILPLLTRFYWGALDFQWYPEACWASEGFQTVQKFIEPRWDPMQSGEDGDRPLLMSVKQYVNGDAANGRLNPLEVADQLQLFADNGLANVQALSPGTNKELRLTLGDIQAMAWLGRYYAEKIRGAVDLYRYQINGLASDHANARTHLITASNHWSQYSARWSTQYVQQVLTRMGLTVVDIAGIQAQVNADIPAPLTPPGPTFTLTTSATNGSIALNPTGGIYTTGTVVTVTANPNPGYTFASWSGDLTGPVNPTNLTMNGDRSVTANFSVLPPGSLSVLFVVGDAASLGASDTAIRNRLQNFGYAVQTVSDDLVTTGDAAGKALILTSATVSSSQVNTKFRDVAVPVINWEYNVQDDYGFTADANTARYFSATQTSLVIANAGHPLAAGLAAGIRTVATVAGDFSWGEPGGSPVIIARVNEVANHPCLYAYEAGAAMSSGTAPARRVHLFLQNETFTSLNADGLKLFDAAVGWTVPVRLISPTLQAEQMKLEWVGAGVLQTSTNVFGPWSDIPGAVSPYLSPATNSAQFFRVTQ